jgi:parallel beta-helix repeat protein
MGRLKWHIILALVLVIVFCSMANAERLYTNESGWWRVACAFNASGTPIQAAVDATAAGDMIEVQSGTYVENVDVNKRLTLQGEGADVVTVRAENTSEHVFEVTADWVNISGFTMTGVTSYPNAGICLNDADHCNISENNASNNYRGICLYSSCNHNALTNNTALNNDCCGIYLGNLSYCNTIANNTLSDNEWDIWLKNSLSDFTNNTLNGTTISFTYSGDVSLKGVSSPAANPSGQYNIAKFISATNQSEDAGIFLNFSYSDSDVSGLDESSLKVWKYNGTTWIEDDWYEEQYLDTTNNVVGVNITSFSVFAPMAKGTLHHINVTLASARLNINDTRNFTAAGHDQSDKEIFDLLFTWSNSNTYVGMIGMINDTATVNFTALHVGIAYITATNDSVISDAVKITVDGAVNNSTTTTDTEFTVTSDDVSATGNFSVDGWVNVTAIGDPEGGANCTIGAGITQIKGVIINVSDSILAEMEAGNGTLTLTICYNDATLEPRGIDADTLAIWKFNETSDKWEKLSSTTSEKCVSVTPDPLCIFALAGTGIMPPYTSGHDPAPDATGVPIDTNITVHVLDDGTGVNMSTIRMTVNELVVTPDITGTSADYILIYDPPTDFNYDQLVKVTIDAADLNETPNEMTTDTYSFTTESAPARPPSRNGGGTYPPGWGWWSEISTPTATPTPAPAPPDTPDLSEIVEDELKKLDPGQILFNPPKKMRVGVRERVEVRISKNITEELSTRLKGRGEPQIENISVNTFMKVRLTGDNFDIKPLSEEEQVVSDEGFTQWEYDVIPNKYGNQILQLIVTVRIKIPGGEEKITYPVFERDINVEVNIIYFITHLDWRWIIGTIIGSGIIGLILNEWRRRQKSNRGKLNTEKVTNGA